MIGEYGSVKVLPVYESNPFKIDLSYVSSVVIKEEGDVRTVNDMSSGEVLDLMSYDRYGTVISDATPFTKLYKGKYVDLVKALKMPSIHLLFLLFDYAKRDCDYVDICEQDFISSYGYSDNSRKVYYTALLQLCNLGVIAKCAGYKTRYWINMNVFVNGNRVPFIDPDSITKKTFRNKTKKR